MRKINASSKRSKIAAFSAALPMLCLAWLCGCANSSSVRGAWQASAPHPAFSRILIVGVNTDFDQRCNFEFALASWFKGTSVTPLVSCNSMTQKEPLTRANINSIVARQQADAVLTSSVVTLKFSEEAGYKIPYYQVTGVGYATGALGAYGVPVTFVQLETLTTVPTINGEVHIITKLYDTKDATLVYTLDMKAKSDDVQSSAGAIETVAQLIAKRLSRDGVLH